MTTEDENELADAKQDAQALAWVPEDELPDSLPASAYNELFPYSRVDGIRFFPVFGPPALPGTVQPVAVTENDLFLQVGSEVRRRNRAGDETENGSISPSCEHAAMMLVVNALRSKGFDIAPAALAVPGDIGAMAVHYLETHGSALQRALCAPFLNPELSEDDRAYYEHELKALKEVLGS